MKSLAHITLAIGLCSSSLLAETLEDYKPLLQNSPFLTQAFKQRLAKSEALGVNNYSFNGYTKIGEEWLICLINKKDQLATWIKINDEIEGYKLTAFNTKEQKLTFEKNSTTASMTIEKPK
ncbi:hypothetical protein ACWPKO_13300 [Coraliomargarita sp. W4R53]